MFQDGNIMLLTTRFFGAEKFTILTPLSLPFSCKFSFPIVGLQISSLPSFALKSPNRIFMWHFGKWSSACSNFSQKLSFKSSLLSSGHAHAGPISHQWPLSTIYYGHCNNSQVQSKCCSLKPTTWVFINLWVVLRGKSQKKNCMSIRHHYHRAF